MTLKGLYATLTPIVLQLNDETVDCKDPDLHAARAILNFLMGSLSSAVEEHNPELLRLIAVAIGMQLLPRLMPPSTRES